MKAARLIAALFFSSFAASTAIAEAPFAVSGYSYSRMANGDHYYECNDARCGSNSAVSFSKLYGKLTFSLPEYVADISRLQQSSFPGAELAFGRGAEQKVGGFLVYRVPLTVMKAGSKTHWIFGFLSKNDVGIVLNVSSANSGQAGSNFDQFVRRLVKWKD